MHFAGDEGRQGGGEEGWDHVGCCELARASARASSAPHPPKAISQPFCVHVIVQENEAKLNLESFNFNKNLNGGFWSFSRQEAIFDGNSSSSQAELFAF